MEKHLANKEHKARTMAANMAIAALRLSVTLSTELPKLTVESPRTEREERIELEKWLREFKGDKG